MVCVSNQDMEGIVEELDLNDDERTVLEEMARVPKTKRARIFHQVNVQRRHRCRNIDVGPVLRSLANKELFNLVGQKRWQATNLGRKVYHYLYDQFLDRRYGFPVVRT